MNRKSSFLTSSIYAATAVIALFGGNDVLAANPVCARSSPGPQICVFKNGTDPDPVLDTNFRFDFTDPLNPDITLLTGSDEWQIWSDVSETNSNPGWIGDIGIDASAVGGNFKVTILDEQGQIGAWKIGSLKLSDDDGVGPNNDPWTGHSSITEKMSPQRHKDTKGSFLLRVFVPLW